MAFNKSHLFDPADQITSSFAKVLAHPARVDILRYLAKNGSTSVEKLADRYPLSKSTISQHLEYLRDSGIVQYREAYPHVIYSIDMHIFRLLITKMIDYCKLIE